MNRGSSSSTTPTRLLRAGGSLAYHGNRSSRVYGDDDVERRERARGILREIRKTRRVRETAAAIDSRECVFAQEPRVDHRGDVTRGLQGAVVGDERVTAAIHRSFTGRARDERGGAFRDELSRLRDLLVVDGVVRVIAGFSLVVVAHEVREESVGTFPRSIVRHDERGDASESVGARSIERASFRGA